MPYYDVIVEETRHVTMRYRVEADSPEQAASEAEQGISISEIEVKDNGILDRSVSLDDIKQIPAFVEVEYDLTYRGGDYHDVGDFVYLPIEGLTDENLSERFQAQTGIDPVHIVHYCFDELYDAGGDLIT